jgi:hypothetical protein
VSGDGGVGVAGAEGGALLPDDQSPHAVLKRALRRLCRPGARSQKYEVANSKTQESFRLHARIFVAV